MSGKSRLRRTRRTNTHDEDHEVKLDDSIDQSDDNKSTKSNDTEKLDTSLKEETNGHDTPNNTESMKDKTTTDVSPKKPEVQQSIEIEKTNGQSEDTNQINTNTSASETPTEKPETIKNGEDQSSLGDMEPISIDSEDPELQFTSEQNSDKSSEVDKSSEIDKSSEVELSPTLNRCRTRRSHTRNLPTPKTPKVPDLNGDTEQEADNKPEPETQEVITIADEIEETSENVSLASNISIDGSIEEKTLDNDLTNASIYVNLGNDTTKNFDITVQSYLEEDNQSMSHFLETTKDKSYGETLRCLTGRKAARNYNTQPRMYSSTIELHSKDLLDSAKKYSPSVGVKRRLDGDSPSDKRMRTEDVSPGILSYLTSPFKNKIGRTEVPSSTPKLTSFKYVHHGSTVIDEVSKVDLDGGDKSTEPRKWCSIM